MAKQLRKGGLIAVAGHPLHMFNPLIRRVVASQTGSILRHAVMPHRNVPGWRHTRCGLFLAGVKHLQHVEITPTAPERIKKIYLAAQLI